MFDNLFEKFLCYVETFFPLLTVLGKVGCKQPTYKMSTKLQYRLCTRMNLGNPMGKCLKIDIEMVFFGIR